MPSSKVKVLRLHHAAYNVASLDDSVAFWTDVLGFEMEGTFDVDTDGMIHVLGITNGTARAAVLRLPGTQSRVELFEIKGGDGCSSETPHPGSLGSAHIALHVEDVPAALKACEEAGWTNLGKTTTTIPAGVMEAVTLVHLSDGRGGRIELMSGDEARILKMS